MRSNKLDPVLILAQSREKQAAASIRRSLQHARQLREQLQQLEQYRNEYEARFSAACASGIHPRILEDYRLFLAKLNQAIERQAEQISVADSKHQQTRARWTQLWQRKNAVEQLVEHEQCAQMERLEQLEQKASDERSGSVTSRD